MFKKGTPIPRHSSLVPAERNKNKNGGKSLMMVEVIFFTVLVALVLLVAYLLTK